MHKVEGYKIFLTCLVGSPCGWSERGMEVLLHRGEHRWWRDDAGSVRGCGSQGPEKVHLKTGKGVSNSVIHPRDVGSANREVVNEGKEGDAADKVHYPWRLGVFANYYGYDWLIVTPYQDTFLQPGGPPQHTCLFC